MDDESNLPPPSQFTEIQEMGDDRRASTEENISSSLNVFKQFLREAKLGDDWLNISANIMCTVSMPKKFCTWMFAQLKTNNNGEQKPRFMCGTALTHLSSVMTKIEQKHGAECWEKHDLVTVQSENKKVR